MAAKVRIQDVVDALQMQFDELPSFVMLDTGEVMTLPLEDIRDAETAEDDEVDEEDKEFMLARRIAFMDGCTRLPGKYEVNEWQMLEDFALSQASWSHREQLLNAIQGKGAFRYFKDTARRLGIEKQWYAFRDEQYRLFAIGWCKDVGLEGY